jgi:hypothetical protein
MTAPANDALAHAHAGLVGRDDIQFSLPRYTAPKAPEWLKAVAHFLREYNKPLEWIVWIVGAAILLFVLYYLIKTYAPALLAWRPKPKQTPDAAPEEWRPTAAEARKLLEVSDALAATGDYAQAVHLILLRSIQDIDERRPKLVRPTLTSREISRLPDLPSAARSAFVSIAQTVERALFAGHPVGAEEFARARAQYADFAFPQAWRIGAMR